MKQQLNNIYIDTYSMFFQHGLCDTASSRNMIGKLTNNNVFSVTNYICYYDYKMPAAFFVAKGSSKMMSGTNLMRYVHHDLYITLYSYPLDYFLSISTFIHSCQIQLIHLWYFQINILRYIDIIFSFTDKFDELSTKLSIEHAKKRYNGRIEIICQNCCG